jgi:hypothetical protein
MRIRRFLVHMLIGLTAPLVFFTGHGCKESGPRVYTAQAYRTDADCLDHYAPLGLVEAEELPSTCDPVCLRVGEQLYVSTVCEPYPSEAAPEPADSPECEKALASLDKPFCGEADGGGGAESDSAESDGAESDGAESDGAELDDAGSD